MNIPPKYEDVVAKLDAALGREAALREELASLRESYESMRDRKNSIVDLQQRLTVAEQLLHEVRDSGDWHSSALEFIHGEGFEVLAKIEAALKPAEEVEGS